MNYFEMFREPTPSSDGIKPASPSARRPRIVTVSGAKGGVGKSVFSTNLAIYLATLGRRVLLVDADPEGSSLHSHLGVSRPVAGCGLLSGVETSVPGLQLVRAGIDEAPRGRRFPRTHRGLSATLRALPDIDHTVIDLGAGTQVPRLDSWLEADQAVFLTTPEPTATENTYRFLRAAFERHLKRSAPDPDVRRRLTEWQTRSGGLVAPIDLVREMEAAGDELADWVRTTMDAFSFRFVLNQTRTRADLQLGDAMRSVTQRRLGLRIAYMGYIDVDDTVWSCVRLRRPLLVESPGAKASKSIEKITRRLLAVNSARRPIDRSVPPESHHDLLEVDRGATEEEVRRAYKRIKDMYADDSLCCYGLFTAPEIEAVRVRLDEAYDVLLDPARRRPYELSTFPEETPAEPLPDREQEPAPTPPAPVITANTEYSGALLRAVRKAQGAHIREISQRTRIGVGFLRAIEEDNYSQLPAPVYVKGFVTQVAKFLQLDGTRVSRSYLRRYQRFLDEQAR